MILVVACAIGVAQRPCSAPGSSEHHTDTEITWHTRKPVKLPAPQVTQQHVRAGFRIQKFMENVRNARILAVSPSGNALISLDWGSNTFFAVPHLRLREGQRLTSPGMLQTMVPGLSFAIAAQFAYPNRQSVAVVGDGGFAMLMAELTTAVQHNLPFKIVILKNNSLPEVRFEQQELGNPPYGCDLGPIDSVAFAKACGAEGFRCAAPSEVRPALTAAVRSSRAAVVEAVVDHEEPPAKPEEVRV